MNLEKVLPPGVNGKISGHLTVKVDEVFWSKSSPGEIFVELLWWGEKNGTIFRPEDITHNEITQKKECCVTYNIKTSPGLFETYLRNCGTITFTVLRGQNKNVIIGTTSVKNIHEIMTQKVNSSYFPIFNPKGLRIGDLHISFELKFVLKQSHYSVKAKSDINYEHNHDPKRKPPSSKPSTATSEDKHLLSEILLKGNELRRAMMMSVLADCPVDKIDTIINDRTSSIADTKKRVEVKEPKLVDFLLGKDMTAEEEKKALETLRCVSPDENLINLAAKCDNGDSKVIKTTCCLHGRKCHKKEEGLHTASSEPLVPETSAPSSLLSSKESRREVTDMGVKEIDNKTMENNFNCYKLIAKTLFLTNDGCRKIYFAPALSEMDEIQKTKRAQHPPGTSFLLEISLPLKGPLARTLKFTTKDYRDKIVTFGQGTTHRLCGTVTWARVRNQILGAVFTVYWRHLNQRVPCPLGSAKLENFNPPTECDSISLALPLYSNTRMLTGHLNISVNLAIMKRGGGEAIFRLEEKPELTDVSDTNTDLIMQQIPNRTEESDEYTSEFSAKPVVLEPSKGPYSVDTDFSSEDVQTEVRPNALDDELVRTINLLNSKPDDKELTKVPSRSRPMNAGNITKKEASVQTTLPLPYQGYQYPDRTHLDQNRYRREDFLKDVNHKYPRAASPPERLKYEQTNLKRDREQLPDTQPVLSNDMKSRPIYDGYSAPRENFHQNSNGREGLHVEPIDYNGTEKIHEFCVKIEKVVGVPLFTGDNDLDCYVDYSFPKVDESGKMTFDQATVGTEVRIALRETEFGTVSKHRFRLRGKLTRALMSLPSHEIIFTLWGRFYRPSPLDYKLGKAVMPLTKLSSLELKYEQQRRQQPITEELILLIEPLESPLTSGYKGPFGELHLTVNYSNATGLSYREWRCKSKDDHYWCLSHLCNNAAKPLYAVPNYECVKTQTDFRGTKTNDYCPSDHYSRPLETFSQLRSDVIDTQRPNIMGQQFGSFRSGTVSSGPLKDYNRNVPKYPLRSESFKNDEVHEKKEYVVSKKMRTDFESSKCLSSRSGQTNFEEYATENRYITGLPRGFDNENIPCSIRKDFIAEDFPNRNERMQPVGESMDRISSYQTSKNFVHGTDHHIPIAEEPLGSGIRENIVKKVLKDIEDRKKREKSLTKSIPKNNSKNEIGVKNVEDTSDVFSSFNLRVDLPNKDDSDDFEVRSQYSFLKTPIGESSLPVNNCIDLESASSTSIKKRPFEADVMNPFLSQSIISINSDSSMFEQGGKDDKLPTVKKSANNDLPSNKFNEILNSLDSKISSRANNPTQNKQTRKQLDNVDYEKENSVSSDETLKSVESLKSYKEIPPSGVVRVPAVGSDSGNNVTIVEVAPKKEKYFKARVEICRALGLPSLEVKQFNGKINLVKPTSHAYLTAVINGKETILRTPTVEKRSNPIWDSAWEVCLPVELLKKSDRELEIFVDLSGDGDETQLRGSDVSVQWPIVLRTGIDLTTITAGLEHASGWFSLTDRALLSRAQIKVIVSPLEDVSQYRNDWLKEYTKSKEKNIEFPLPEKSSLAKSLQEKLYEMEKLTECMKKKMENRSRWDESPPLSLLSVVQKHSPELPEKVISSYSRSKQPSCSTEPAPVCHEASVIVLSDDSEVCEDKSSSDGLNTYTVSEGHGTHQKSEEEEDSLETSSQAINRIITQVREKK